MCCLVLAPGFLYTMCSVNVFVIDYILRCALQAHNNSCCQFCECVWCMCMLWEEVEHAVWHVLGDPYSSCIYLFFFAAASLLFVHFFYHSCIYTIDIVIPLLSALASNMCVWQLQSRVFPSHYIKYIIIPKNL